jgi:hypothetical protein
MAMLWDDYRDTQVPASALGGALVSAVARVGRLLPVKPATGRSGGGKPPK